MPWRGRPGITETVADIMARERRTARLGHRRVVEAIPPLRPLTSKLPNPAAPVVAATGPSRPAPSPAISPTVGVSFHATDLGEASSIPPDTMGSVGPTQILVHTNGRVKVFDKAGSVGSLNVSDDTFWSSVRGGFTVSDPHVEYDRLSGRWFLTIINVPVDGSFNPVGPNRVLIAVSSGPTITNTGSFTFFQFEQDDPGAPNVDANRFLDYPTLGVDKNALYIGGNMFSQTLSSFQDTTAFVVDKADLIASTLTVTAFRDLIGATIGPFTPQGVQNQDPAATEGYFIGVDNFVFSKLVLRRITDPGGTPAISGNIGLTVPTTRYPILGVPQPNPAPDLDDIDDRLFAAMISRNPAGQPRLWTAHNIRVNTSGVATNSGNRDGSRWYEIGSLTGTPTLIQSGTLFDSASSNPFSYWMPSIAANGQGHAAIGASRAGKNASTGFAGAAVAERLASDAGGSLGAPSLVQSSSFGYDVGVDDPRRWGDYSQTVIDPNDNMTFWTFQEYADATDSWGVRVIQLRAPPPATPASAIPSTIAPGQSSVSVQITGTSTAGSSFFDPGPDTGGPGFPNHISATVNGGVAVNSVTYTDPTHLILDLDTTSAGTGSKNVTITNPDGQETTGSGILTVGSPDSTPPTAFTLVAPADTATVGTSSPTFSWNASSDQESGIAKYQLFVDGSLDRDDISGAATSTTPLTPIADGARTWRIRAVNGDGLTTDSATRNLTVDTTPPDPFALLSPADGAIVTSATPTLSWQASADSGSGLSEYELYVDGSLNQDGIAPGTTAISPSGPLLDGSHAWRVAAIDGVGNVRNSATRSFTVDTATPSPFGLVSPSDGALVLTTTPTLSWEASFDAGSGVAKYQLFVDGTLNRDDVGPGITSTTPGAPLPEGPHAWFVRAVDGVGNSTDSPQRSFTVELPVLHERALTLRLRRHLRARGTISVADEYPPCADGVLVEIQRKKAGEWTTVRTTTTDASGSYRKRLPDREGRYRAHVNEATMGADVCEPATSPGRRHRH